MRGKREREREREREKEREKKERDGIVTLVRGWHSRSGG